MPKGWNDVVNEEVVADVAGNLWQAPSFWTAIHEQDASAFRRALYVEVIEKLMVVKKMPYRSWALDLAKARARFVGHMLLFLESEVEPAQLG